MINVPSVGTFRDNFKQNGDHYEIFITGSNRIFIL